MSNRSVRMLGGICLVSLSVNVFMLGMLASHLLQPGHGHSGPPDGAEVLSPDLRTRGPRLMRPGPVGLPAPLLASLTPAHRAAAAEVRSRYEDQMSASIRRRLEPQAEVVALLPQEVIDESALEAAFAAVRERDNETARIAQAMLLEMARTLGPEARLRLAAMLQRPMMRPRQLIPRGIDQLGLGGRPGPPPHEGGDGQ